MYAGTCTKRAPRSRCRSRTASPASSADNSSSRSIWNGGVLVVADLLEDRDVLSKEPSRRPDDAPAGCADDVYSKVHGQRLRKAWATEAIRQPVTTGVNSVAAGGPR